MRPGCKEPASLFFLAGLMLLMAGCGDSGPPTYVIQGKIIFERGGTVQSLYDRQGIIEFQSVEQPDVRAFGEILEDGSFTLSCVQDGKPIASNGAVAGKYRGRFNLDEGVQHLVAPQFLDFEKSQITMTVPTQGEVIVKVWR